MLLIRFLVLVVILAARNQMGRLGAALWERL